MKRTVLYLLGGLTLMFAASSCSSEEPAADPASQSADISAGTAKITVTAKLPEGIRSRATSDNPWIGGANPWIMGRHMKNFYFGIWEMNERGEMGQMLCDPIELHGDELASIRNNDDFIVNLEIPRRKRIRIMCWTDNFDTKLVNLTDANGDGTGICGFLCEPLGGTYDKFAFACDVDRSGLNDASIELSLTRPYAEVAVVSNQTETEEFKSVWKDGLFTDMSFVDEQADGTKIHKWPIGYIANSRELVWNENPDYSNYPQPFAQADYPELIEGYKTLTMKYVLCGQLGLGVDPLNWGRPFQFTFSRGRMGENPDIVTTKTIEHIMFQPNTRYIFVDNKENGGIWNAKFNLKLIVDSNFAKNGDGGPRDL